MPWWYYALLYVYVGPFACVYLGLLVAGPWLAWQRLRR